MVGMWEEMGGEGGWDDSEGIKERGDAGDNGEGNSGRGQRRRGGRERRWRGSREVEEEMRKGIVNKIVEVREVCITVHTIGQVPNISCV